MKERVFDVAIKHPIWILLASIILVIAAASGAKNLVFKSDYRVFFSEENPQLTSFESMQKIYNKSDNVAFIIAPKEGPFSPQSALPPFTN